MTASQFQSYRHSTVGPWCRHESIKNLVSVPMTGGSDFGYFGSRERPRPGSRGREVVRRINSVLALQPGWDGGNASSVTLEAVEAVVEVLNAIELESVPVPDVSPSIDGGLLLEWHRNGFELEVWVGPDGATNVTYDHGETSWEATWEEGGMAGVQQVLLHLAESVPQLVG